MKKKIYNMLLVLSFVLAIGFGIFFPDFMKQISFLGEMYVNLLKFIVIPILFTTISVTVYETKEKKFLGRTILLFIGMFLLTFLLTSLVVWILKPGKGILLEEIIWSGEVIRPSLSQVLVNLIPTSFLSMFQNQYLFFCILFSFFFGFCAKKVEKGKKLMEGMDTLKNIFYQILEGIMLLTPIGVFSLVGNMIATYQWKVLETGIRYLGMAYLCSILVFILVMMIPSCIVKKISPWKYLKKLKNVFLMTLTTCSSVATLPTTMKTCKKEFGISSKTTDVVVPLGCTIHMCGGAVSFALLAIFCTQYFGITITETVFIEMILAALFINMAAPGIPNGGIVIGASYLSMFHIPLTFMGLYTSMYKLLDMAYTTLNVTGDITANILLDQNK